jgi:integrase
MSNVPKGDVWRLPDKNPDSQNYNQVYKFDFSFFQSAEIKNILKEYIWTNYRTENRVTRSLSETVLKFKFFDRFCREAHIYSLKQLTNGLISQFQSFLHIQVSAMTKKPLSYSYQNDCFTALKSLVHWCRIYLPEAVPAVQIFTGNEYRNVHRRLKVDFIPDNILRKVNESLKYEDNSYVKYGIIILECTGMRLGDLMLLTIDCTGEHPISGHTISWFDHKNRKSRNHMPIPVECKEAIDHLRTVTEKIRKQADDDIKNKLFIYSPKIGTNKRKIISLSRYVFGKWCRGFSKEHNICDENGNLYVITSHKFRRTLATDMLSKGTNIKIIQETLGHISPATTKMYYADIKDAARAEMFGKIGVLGNISDVTEEHVPNEADRRWFKENCAGKARMSDGYCTLPIQNGKLCSRLLSRQKCYLCSRYITTIDNLDAHRDHLSELQALLESNIYGEHYAAHIVPTITVLKEIIMRLEALKNEK